MGNQAKTLSKQYVTHGGNSMPQRMLQIYVKYQFYAKINSLSEMSDLSDPSSRDASPVHGAVKQPRER